MKKFKIMSLFMAILMAVSIFAGCGSDENKPEATADNGGTVNSGDAENTDGKTDNVTEVKRPEKVEDNKYTAFPNALTAEKVGKIDDKMITSYASTSGLIYKADDGKYGIISLDGKNDTGAKYASCEEAGKFFEVSAATDVDRTNVAAVNNSGLVDSKGNEIVPMSYGYVEVLSERYVRVVEATGITEDRNECLFYSGSSYSAFGPSSDDIMYKGKWYIYDVTTGKKVAYVTGSEGYDVEIYGDFIEYINDDFKRVRVNHKGEIIPEDASLFSNGYYSLVKNNVGGVYDSDNNMLYSYALDSFVPYASASEYLIGRKTIDGVSKYVLIDKTGKTVSAEFDAEISAIYGELVYVDKKICDFSGKVVIEGSYDYVDHDEQTGYLWNVYNISNDDKMKKECTYITKDGTILWQSTANDEVSGGSYFNISKKIGNDDFYYSLKDKDFTIKGSDTYIPWLVKTSGANSTYNLVDTISGETIISGYSGYNYVAIEGSGVYVYAKMAGGGYDIYTVM